MTVPKRAMAPRVVIPLLAAFVSPLAGCGSGMSDDFERAKSSGALKTPSDIRREAEAKYGKPKEAAPANTSKRAPK
jgi:hypothetical protein